jgi:hypothetical protein
LPTKCALEKKGISFQGFFDQRNRLKRNLPLPEGKTGSKRIDGLIATNRKQPLYVTVLVATLRQTLLPEVQYCQSQWL